MSRRQAREAAAAFLFLLPNLLGFLALTAAPVIGSFLISFLDWNILSPPKPAGLANYVDLVHDPLFWKSLANTATFVFAKVPLNVVLSLALAVILHSGFRGAVFFRAVYFLPVVCSSVSIALVWLPLLDSDGVVNHLLGLLGLGPYRWLSSAELAMPSIVAVAVWKEIGYFLVIFLAGLQGIPSSYYEAARLDGAGRLREFFAITVPLISPTTFFVIVTSIIGSFQVFDITTVMTQGGPGNATNTLVMLIYQSGFRSFRMGYASAVAYALFAIVFAFTFAQHRMSRRWVFH